MSNANFIKKRGLDLLTAELKQLKEVESPQVIDDIAEARAHGDLKENSEYKFAKEKQVMIQTRINELEYSLSIVSVFQPDEIADKKEIRFGAMCILKNQKDGKEKSIQIVSPLEANFSKGFIAIDAPFAKALLGKREKEVVQISMGDTKHEFLIESIKY